MKDGITGASKEIAEVSWSMNEQSIDATKNMDASTKTMLNLKKLQSNLANDPIANNNTPS